MLEVLLGEFEQPFRVHGGDVREGRSKFPMIFIQTADLHRESGERGKRSHDPAVRGHPSHPSRR